VCFQYCILYTKHNNPYTDIGGLLALVDKLGVEVRSEYSNDMRCAEYVSHIAEVLRKDLISELKIQKYVTLLLNASTDKASVEDLTLYVRYITDNKVEVFLSVIPLKRAIADGYFQAVQQELEKLGHNWLSSSEPIGIGTNGAASLIGVENEFVQKVHKNLSHVINIHCIAHRISVLSAVKNVK
jgi:hypothetical protein